MKLRKVHLVILVVLAILASLFVYEKYFDTSYLWSPDTTSWKTYSDPSEHLLVKYPQDWSVTPQKGWDVTSPSGSTKSTKIRFSSFNPMLPTVPPADSASFTLDKSGSSWLPSEIRYSTSKDKRIIDAIVKSVEILE